MMAAMDRLRDRLRNALEKRIFEDLRTLFTEAAADHTRFWRQVIASLGNQPPFLTVQVLAIAESRCPNLERHQPILAKIMGVRLVQAGLPAPTIWHESRGAEKRRILAHVARLPRTGFLEAWHAFIRRHDPELVVPVMTLPHLGEVVDRLVFAADDSPIILRMLDKNLRQVGWTCQGFEQPRHLLEALLETRPALVFTDMNMPELSGLAIAVTIRAVYRAEELPVVLVSAPEETEHTTFFEAVMTKPFNRVSVTGIINTLAEKERDS